MAGDFTGVPADRWQDLLERLRRCEDNLRSLYFLLALFLGAICAWYYMRAARDG